MLGLLIHGILLGIDKTIFPFYVLKTHFIYLNLSLQFL